MREFDLIEKIQDWQKKNTSNQGISLGNLLETGIGDDCAVLNLDYLQSISPKKNCPGKYLVSSIDSMVSEKHFFMNLTSPSNLGYKLVARATSDIAAMGALPFGLSIALNLPKTVNEEYLKEFYNGVFEAISEYKMSLIGGDISNSETFSLTAHVFGFSSSPPIKRSTASPSDDIWVSGRIGGAGAGLKLKKEEIKSNKSKQDDISKLHLERLERPRARVEVAKEISEKNLATSMIDISDGLIADLKHILNQSNLSCTLNLEDIPLEMGLESDEKTILIAATSGEDYEILFTAKKQHSENLKQVFNNHSISLSKIGEMEACSNQMVHGEIYNVDKTPLNKVLEKHALNLKGGFEHF